MVAVNLTAALHESYYRFLWRRLFVGAIPGFSASKGFVCLDELSFAAQCREFAFAHRFADAVHHEPCRFIRDAKHAMQLTGAHAFFAGADEEGGHQPLVEWDMRALEQGSDCNGELLAACVALIPAGAGADACRFT